MVIRLVRVLLVVLLTSNSHQLLVLNGNNGDSDRKGTATNSSYCIAQRRPAEPDCKVSFREDSGWTNQFNATCIRNNVFLLPFDRLTKQSPSSTDARRSYAMSTPSELLPPYVRFTCTASIPIDFDFEGNGAIEFLRIWKSVSYINGTGEFDVQTLNVELLMSPSATGKFKFHSIQNLEEETSFFIFAEPPEEGPFLVTPGPGGIPLTAHYNANSSELILPCIVSNRIANIDLFKLNGSVWSLVGNSREAKPGLKYTPEVGFTLSGPFEADAAKVQFQCRQYAGATGDILNFTLSQRNRSTTVPILPIDELLKIQLETDAICKGPEPPIRFFNVFVRNPTESHIVAKCLLRGLEHCGEDSIYHKRIEGTNCPENVNNSACSMISSGRLHREGLLVCIGRNQSASLEYFKGFDGKIYTDPTLAPPSAILKVKVAPSGMSTMLPPSPNELVTGVRYEVKCSSVEFPLVKESQLLYVKYRNGTEELLAGDLVWWKGGKDMYLTADMVQLECRDRLWSNNEFFNSSIEIVIKDKACGVDQFRCKSGQCVRDTWRCDGDNDCLDSSDEYDCHVHVCKPEFFKCLSGQCIALDKRCNNKRECPDASDESLETCTNTTCSTEEFKCQNGQCVLAHFLCDGDSDCYDKSDESQANCAKYFPTIMSENDNVTFVEGSAGELVCETIPLPSKLQSRIEWWRHNLNITDAERLWRSVDSTKLALKFSAVQASDSGDYTCFAQNSLSRSFLTFHVTVTTSAPSDTLCDNELEGSCMEQICKAHPKLHFCQVEVAVSGQTGQTNHEGLPIWITFLGIILLLAVVIIPGVLIYKYQANSNLRIPRGAVRFGQEDDHLALS